VDVRRRAGARGVQLVGERLPLLVEHVTDDDRGALGDEHPRGGATDVARAATDQRDLALYSTLGTSHERESSVG